MKLFLSPTQAYRVIRVQVWASLEDKNFGPRRNFSEVTRKAYYVATQAYRVIRMRGMASLDRQIFGPRCSFGVGFRDFSKLSNDS